MVEDLKVQVQVDLDLIHQLLLLFYLQFLYPHRIPLLKEIMVVMVVRTLQVVEEVVQVLPDLMELAHYQLV